MGIGPVWNRDRHLLNAVAKDATRRQLGLGETARPGEIRSPYQELGDGFHPDYNPADAEAQARMPALTEAYRLLMAYAEDQGAAEAGSLSDEDVERLGRTFLKLEARRDELKKIFRLADEDLNLNLGPGLTSFDDHDHPAPIAHVVPAAPRRLLGSHRGFGPPPPSPGTAWQE